jgi:hypothetical protein
MLLFDRVPIIQGGNIAMPSEHDGPSFEEKFGFKPESVAIATTTFYPKWYSGKENTKDLSALHHKRRGDLALEFCKRAIKIGYRVVVVDGSGENSSFRQELDEVGVVVQSETEKGMSGSRRQALRAAGELDGAAFVVWSEPEKTSFITNLATAMQPAVKNEADIVIPSRSEAWMKQSYPNYQVDAENKSNRKFNSLLQKVGLLGRGEYIDAWFGPRIIRNDPELMKLFQMVFEYEGRGAPIDDVDRIDRDKTINEIEKLVNPENWPDATFLPLIRALAEGYKITSQEVLYRHPKKQTALESNDDVMKQKRREQYLCIMVSTVHLLRQIEIERKLREIKHLRKSRKLHPQTSI